MIIWESFLEGLTRGASWGADAAGMFIGGILLPSVVSMGVIVGLVYGGLVVFNWWDSR